MEPFLGRRRYLSQTMRRLTILIAALALVAAACGSGETSEAFVSPSTTTPPPASDQSPGTTPAPATATPSNGASTISPPPTPAALPDSDYPDVTVADLAGGELNLRELALEAEPVLLWFWAPH